LARVERAHRIELILSRDTAELLAYQHFLAEAEPIAAAGTLHSWSAFLTRQLEDSLAAEVSPVPRLPCDPAGAGRDFPVRPGFSIMTGYVDDSLSQLAGLRARGVLTDAEYESAKANALR
jgi:hypothetical protein